MLEGVLYGRILGQVTTVHGQRFCKRCRQTAAHPRVLFGAVAGLALCSRWPHCIAALGSREELAGGHVFVV